MKTTLMIIAAVAFTAMGDFTDDFQSYTPGDHLESSPNWDKEPDGGYVQIAEQGSNNVIEAVFPDSAFIGYICTAAGFWADGSVEMDFAPEGTGSFSNVYARLDIMAGGSYAAGLTVFFGSLTYAYIAYVNAEGEYELLYSDLGPILTPGSWANIRLHTEGTDPVALTLFIDNEQVTKVYDTTHLLGNGLSGFAMFYDDQQPAMLADNFQVITSGQSLIPTTLGSIKAMFR